MIELNRERTQRYLRVGEQWYVDYVVRSRPLRGCSGANPDVAGLAGDGNRGLVPYGNPPITPIVNLRRVRRRREPRRGGVGQQAARQPRAERSLQLRTIKEQFTLLGVLLSCLRRATVWRTMSKRASLDPSSQFFLIHLNVAKQCHHIASRRRLHVST